MYDLLSLEGPLVDQLQIYACPASNVALSGRGARLRDVPFPQQQARCHTSGKGCRAAQARTCW